MRKIVLKIPAMMAVLALWGCSIFPAPNTRSTAYHDLGFPAETFLLPAPVDIKHFDGSIGGRTKMCFRSGGNRIKMDSFNRWSQPPAGLLQQYLALAIRGDDKNKKQGVFEISGEMIRFDGDIDEKTANVTVLVNVSKVKDNVSSPVLQRIFSSTVPFDGQNASSFAKAMGTAVEKIAATLAAEIKTANANK